MNVLRTARLTLEPWKDDYLDDLFRLSSDQRMMHFIGDGRPWTREHTTERHQATLRHWKAHGFGWRAIFQDGVFVGVGAIWRMGEMGPATVAGIADGAIEIGWWIAPEAWGHGLATEAALALRDEAFGKHGAELVIARYVPANVASGRIMIRLGMKLWGDHPAGGDHPARIYVQDRASWQDASRPAPEV